MELLIIVAIVASVLTVVLGWFSAECTDYDWKNTVAGILAGLMGCVALGSLIVVCFLGWSWSSSEYKMKIINREYHTNYTREEVFYASDVIDTIRQLDRLRIELNGNLTKEDSKE